MPTPSGLTSTLTDTKLLDAAALAVVTSLDVDWPAWLAMATLDGHPADCPSCNFVAGRVRAEYRRLTHAQARR